MKPKERVLTTLQHREPDRVPFDLGSTPDTSIHYLAFNNLAQYMGKPHLSKPKEKTDFMEVITSIVHLDREVVEALKIDVRGLVPGSYRVKWNDVVRMEGEEAYVVDSFGARWLRPPDGYYFDQKESSFPLAGIVSEAEVKAFDWPVLGTPERVKGLRSIIEELGEQYAIALGDPVGGIFAQGFRLRGYMNFYLDLASNPSLACSLMDQLTDLKIQYWDRVLEEVGDLVTLVMFEDDLGQQDRPLISPQMYRKLVKPRHQRLFNFVKQKTKGSVYVMFHSDGSIYDVIPDLIEVGIDILNPIQVSCAKMNTAVLKREFGKDLIFWGGGVDTQNVLPFKTPGEVRDEVKKRIDDLAPGGGFVFAAVHNIQPEVPPENIMAMWEALQDYGKY